MTEETEAGAMGEERDDEEEERRPAEPTGGGAAFAFWCRFCLIYLAGVSAAMSLGKMTPISVALRGDLSLSLAQFALLTSLVTAVAAALGLFVSHLIRPLPPHRVLVAGLAVMGLAGLFCARAGGFGTMVAGRLVESVGYVVVVVVAPVLLFTMERGRRLTAALAVWGTYMPVGLALGNLAGGVLSQRLHWRGWLTLAAVMTLVIAVAALRLPASSVGARSGGERASAHDDAETAGWGRTDGERVGYLRRLLRPALLGIGFATISGSIVTYVSLYPTYLHEEFGLSAEPAGTLTGVVSLSGVAGGFLAVRLLVGGVAVRYLFVVALLMPAGAFAAFAGAGGAGLSLGGAVVIALANELVVATVFAAVPMVVRVVTDLGAANGLVAQFGSAGALALPPLVSLVATAADGWWSVGPCLLVACGAGLVLLLLAVRKPVNVGESTVQEAR